MEQQIEMEFRKTNEDDNLEEIAELLYLTDQYIYPYWFGSLENCKRELPALLLEDKFFFNINNLFIMKDVSNNKIIGVVCVVDKNVDLSYDYSKLEKVNERYRFTVNTYIKALIEEVKNADFAYISNVCVHPGYRGKHIGSIMVRQVIEVYRRKCFKEMALDVLADNSGAIKLYNNLGFKKSSDVFEGFNDPMLNKPAVFSMKVKLNKDKDGL